MGNCVYIKLKFFSNKFKYKLNNKNKKNYFINKYEIKLFK